MKRISILLTLVLLSVAGHAAVDIQKSGDFPSSIKHLAIAPLPCSAEVNCKKVEKRLNKVVQKHFPQAQIVDTAGIKQALFDMSVVEPNKEAVIEAARKLGCDAVLLPAVLGSERTDHWNVWTEYDSGKVHSSDAASVTSSVRIIIMDLEGKLLMKGEATGESYLQTDPTYFAESQFDKILRKALD